MSANIQDRIAEVLAEHFWHNTDYAGIGSQWSVECNCGMVLTAESLPTAERRFTSHQAVAITVATGLGHPA